MARHDHSTTRSAELVKPAATVSTRQTRRDVIGALVATVAAAPPLRRRARRQRPTRSRQCGPNTWSGMRPVRPSMPPRTPLERRPPPQARQPGSQVP